MEILKLGLKKLQEKQAKMKAFLVPLESLESVESKYGQKEHFLNYYEGAILKMLQLDTFFLSFLLLTCSFEAQ